MEEESTGAMESNRDPWLPPAPLPPPSHVPFPCLPLPHSTSASCFLLAKILTNSNFLPSVSHLPPSDPSHSTWHACTPESLCGALHCHLAERVALFSNHGCRARHRACLWGELGVCFLVHHLFFPPDCELQEARMVTAIPSLNRGG